MSTAQKREQRPTGKMRRRPPADTSVADNHAVVDLDEWRRRRDLARLDATMLPCTGVCTCWGAELGGQP